MKPQRGEYAPFLENYISHVKHDNVMDALSEAGTQALELIRSIDSSMENHAYAEGKWTVKQVFIHCIDTERIFATRALGFARGEKQKSLPFDENTYADNSHPETRSLADIAEELESVAKSTYLLYKSFSPEVLAAKGEFPSGPVTVNTIGFATSGHWLHHLGILRERYLKSV